MPFNSAISNQAARRASGYQARQFIVANPGTVVFRCQPSAAATDTTYAQFNYGSVSVGSFGAVKEGQTVIISSDTAMTNILFRGRVRKVPTASVFYINQTSFALQTSHYVSVIDQYDLVERLERITGPTGIFKDYDLTYQNLPPVITNLQSSYILPTTASTASLVLAPTAQAMASGATVASWLWDVADGTITSGTSTTQNITVSFPAGYRWVILRVTDSNGVQTRYCFEVWVGNPDAATDGQLLRATEGASITGNWENGWNASIEWFDGLAGLLPGTRITIWSEHRYGDGTTSTTVDFVGYLQDDAATLTGDENYAQIKTTSITAYGFGALLGQLKAPSARITRTSSPSRWGDIASPTAARVLTFALAWHTTALNLCSFQWAATDSSYESDDLDLEQFHALELMVDLLARYNAQPTFAPSGEIRAARNACYLSSAARNALTTITTLTTNDFSSVTLDTRYDPPVGSLLMPAVAYTTSTDLTTGYMAKAPAVTSLYSGEEQTAGNQVLVANAGDAAWRTELAARAGDELAYLNRATTMTLDLADSYSDLVPTNDQWFVLQLSAADNPSGRAYSTERWQLIEISINVASPDGVRTVSATFQIETVGEGAQVLVTRLASNAPIPNPNIPAIGPFDGLDQPWNSPTNEALDLNYSPISQDLGRGLPPGGRQPQEAGCETLAIPMWTDTAVQTSFVAQLGKLYQCAVVGRTGRIGIKWTYTWDFTASSGGWVAQSAGARTPNLAIYTGGTGWQAQQMVVNVNPNDIAAYIHINKAINATIVEYSMTYDLVKGDVSAANPAFSYTALWSPPFDTIGQQIIGGVYLPLDSDGTDKVLTWTGTATIGDAALLVWANYNFNGVSTGSTTLKKFSISGLGTPPPLSGGTMTIEPFGDVLDAFYELDEITGVASPYTGTDGLNYYVTPITVPGAFNPEHAYLFDLIGQGVVAEFRFKQSTYTDLTRDYLFVTICPREVT